MQPSYLEGPFCSAPIVCQIEKKMIENMTQEAQTNGFKEVVDKLIPDNSGKDPEILANLFIHSMMSLLEMQKMLKKPKFELEKIIRLQTEKATG